MRLLAIETATEACSVALSDGNEVRELFEIAPRQHAELVLLMAERLLAESQLSVHALDGLAFGRGPGAFTGVRIAVGVIQGMALGTGLPVAPVSTLAALAHGARRVDAATKVACALDARMHEVYWGLYQNYESDRWLAVTPDSVAKPQAVPTLADSGWCSVGTGWSAYPNELAARCGNMVTAASDLQYPHAYDIAILARQVFSAGETVSAEAALPEYVRNQVTK